MSPRRWRLSAPRRMVDGELIDPPPDLPCLYRPRNVGWGTPNYYGDGGYIWGPAVTVTVVDVFAHWDRSYGPIWAVALRLSDGREELAHLPTHLDTREQAEAYARDHYAHPMWFPEPPAAYHRRQAMKDHGRKGT